MVLETDDAALVDAARRGDLLAFEELVRRHRTLAYRVGLRMLGDPLEAEDVAQEALVDAWLALPRFRGASAFSTWLYRIVANRCLNALRTRRPAEPLPEDAPATGAGDPAERAQGRARFAALEQAIGRLTPEQRAPLVLRELEGLSYEEIADVLETTVPAVKGRLHRARLALVTALREWR